MDIKLKNKRSPNYTLHEKQNLLLIIAKYKNIIDSKKTGAFYIQQKQDAWRTVVKEYNSVCTTGPRDENMLKHFYNNIKHRAKKSASESVVGIEDILKDLKKQRDEDKNDIRKITGGSRTPSLSDDDHQIMTILDPQIQLDENPYNGTTVYLGDKVEVEIENPEIKVEPNLTTPSITHSNLTPLDLTPKLQRKRRMMPRRKTKLKTKHSVETLQKIYFQKKIELTYFQKRNEIQTFMHNKMKNDLEIEILKKQLEKAKKDLS